MKQPLRSARHQGTPLRRRARTTRITTGQEDLKLVGEQLVLHCAFAPRPVSEVSFRPSLLTEPEALPVVRQDLHRRRTPIAEHEHRTRERILAKQLATHSCEPVDAAPKICWLHRDQQSHLRRDLYHRGRLQNASDNRTTSTPAESPSSSSSRSPSGASKRTTVFAANSPRVSTCTNCAAFFSP